MAWTVVEDDKGDFCVGVLGAACLTATAIRRERCAQIMLKGSRDVVLICCALIEVCCMVV